MTSPFGGTFRLCLALLILGTPLVCPSYTGAADVATNECDASETPKTPVPLDAPHHECGTGCLCHGALTHSSVWNTSVPDLASSGRTMFGGELLSGFQGDVAVAVSDHLMVTASPIHFPTLAFGQHLCALTGCRLL